MGIPFIEREEDEDDDEQNPPPQQGGGQPPQQQQQPPQQPPQQQGGGQPPQQQPPQGDNNGPPPEEQPNEPPQQGGPPSNMGNDIGQQFEAMEDRIMAIENEIETVGDRTDKLDNRQEVIEGKMESVEEQMGTIETYVQELLGIYDAVAATVNPLFGDDLRSLIPSLDSEVEEAADDYDLKDFDLQEMPSAEKLREAQELVEKAEEHDFEFPEFSEDELMDKIEQIEANNGEESTNGATDENVEETDPVEEAPEDVEPIDKQTFEQESSYQIVTVKGGLNDEVVALHWLDKLVEEVGYRGTIRLLDYYKRIGWVSPTAKHQLLRRMRLYKLNDDQKPGDDTSTIPEHVHDITRDYLGRIST